MLESSLPRPARRLILALTLMGAVPGAAVSQAAGARDTATQRLEPQTIRGERGATVIGGSSVLVVNVDSSRARVAPSLADLLRSVPLVLVRTNSRGEVELSVRGSESRQVGIMMNGLPLSAGWDGRADPSLVPLTGISRVEYVRSTASVLGGPNTLGGVIDLGFDEPQAGGLAPRLSLGTDQTGARLLAATVASSIASERSRISWRAGGGVRQVDGLVRAQDVPDPAGEPALRTNTDSRQYDFLGALGWSRADGTSVRALVSGYEAQRGVAPELHLSGPRYWRYPLQSRRLLQVRATAPRIESGFGTTELELGGGVLAGVMRVQTFADDNYSPVASTEHGNEQVNSVRFALTQSLKRGTQIRAAVTGNNVFYDETLGAAASADYRQDLLSAGLETSILLGSRTMVSAGAVLDRGVTLAAGGRAPLRAKGLPGWRVGATRQVRERVRLHASASSRGRFPALRELYSGALNRFEPNPDLRPERLLATEAGVSLGDAADPSGFTAQFTAFRHELSDGIVRVGFAGTDRFRRINRDETRSVGLEALMGWSGGPDRPAMTLDVVTQRVAIKDVTAAGAERKPEHMPNFRAMLDGTVPVWGKVTVGANLAHVGRQYCVNPDTDSDVSLAGTTLAGVTAHRTFTLGPGRGFRALRVLAGLDNVANAALYEQCGLPRAGRTLRLGIELR
jgi:iron complex outermembrane recepter protein